MFTYGPVPSRRLGRSIGVSLIRPKACSYNCVYCQLGRTTQLQVRRESFFPRDLIFKELKNRVSKDKPDYITFAGDGEPTLSKDIGWIIKQCKDTWDIPVAVLTNGSLLFQDDIKSELMSADVVLPSLDAGNSKTFKSINRAHRDIQFENVINGLVDFRSAYKGQMWLEVMLVNDINTSMAELLPMKEGIENISPDRIYVMLPTRPPAEKWVKPPDPAKLLLAQKLFSGSIPISGLEYGDFGVKDFEDVKEAIIEIGSRHPLRKELALNIEAQFNNSGTVEKMIKSKELIEVNYEGEEYVILPYFVRGK